MAQVETNQERGPGFFWHIVEESLDEAEFLWGRWERLLDSHQLPLAKVEFWVEQRLRGALDGVRLAGDAAIEPLLEPALASDAMGRVAAASNILATLGTPPALDLLVRALGSFSGNSLDAVRRGIEVSDDPRVLSAIAGLLLVGSPQAQAAVLDVYAFRGVDPGSAGMPLLESTEPLVRAAALRAARIAPGLSTQHVIRALASGEPEVLVAAIEAGLLHGSAEAWNTCLRVVTPSDDAAAYSSLLPVLAMSGAPHAERLLLQLLDSKVLQRDAAFALGFSGRLEAAEACMSCMRAGHVVQVAADSFSMITGLDLTLAKLVLPETKPAEAPAFDDDELDESLVPNADDELPSPDVDGVASWWQQHKAVFASQSRYLRGQFFDTTALQRALAAGPSLRRHELARELAIRSAGTYRVATRAWAREQHRQLARLSALDARSLARIPGWAPLL